MKKQMRLALLLSVLLTGFAGFPAKAAVPTAFTVSGMFSSDMVLQRDAPIKIWGWSADTGAVIHAVFQGHKATGIVGPDGAWELVLSPLPADTAPGTLRIYADGAASAERDFAGVLVGDVWLVGGQSNADLLMSTIWDETHLYDRDKQAVNPGDPIRLFATSRWDAVKTPSVMASPQATPIRETYHWQTCTLDSVRGFSALGYFFAKEIADKTKNRIPLGMIMVASGGSPLAELMPTPLGQALGDTVPANAPIPLGGMFNALLAPVQKMAIRGMIFYQGESDTPRAASYAKQLSRYIQDLRERFGRQFPFYYVQLSSHPDPALTPGTGFGPIQELRVAQWQALKLIPNSALVVSIDQGWKNPDVDNLRPSKDIDWAHPIRKKPIGQRLAALALARDYGVGSLDYASSPMPSEAVWDAAGVRIRFQHVGDGLSLLDGGTQLRGFTMVGPDGTVHPAIAQITAKNTVRVEGIVNSQEIRYAYMPFAPIEAANLGTKAGLSAPTFVLRPLRKYLCQIPLPKGSGLSLTPKRCGTVGLLTVNPVPLYFCWRLRQRS